MMKNLRMRRKVFWRKKISRCKNSSKNIFGWVEKLQLFKNGNGLICKISPAKRAKEELAKFPFSNFLLWKTIFFCTALRPWTLFAGLFSRAYAFIFLRSGFSLSQRTLMYSSVNNILSDYMVQCEDCRSIWIHFSLICGFLFRTFFFTFLVTRQKRIWCFPSKRVAYFFPIVWFIVRRFSQNKTCI